jgi:hypothetical protein
MSQPDETADVLFILSTIFCVRREGGYCNEILNFFVADKIFGIVPFISKLTTELTEYFTAVFANMRYVSL